MACFNLHETVSSMIKFFDNYNYKFDKLLLHNSQYMFTSQI